MGQKVIPISLRLNKDKNWNFNWIVSKTNYANFIYFQLEVKQFFENLFNHNKSKVIKIDIKKGSKNINIYVYLQQDPKIKNLFINYSELIQQLSLILKQEYFIKIFIIKIKVKNLKINRYIAKIFNSLKNQKRINYQLRQIVYIIIYSLVTKKINLITNMIKQNLQKKKKHKGFLFFCNRTLINFFNINSFFIGYKLQIKGRINGSKRSRKLIFQKGKIPLNTFDYSILYHQDHFETPSGICSIKLWIFLEKNSNNIKIKQKAQLNHKRNSLCYFRKKQSIKNNLKQL